MTHASHFRAAALGIEWDDDPGPLGAHDVEYQIARDLQVQGHMYAAAEQLASLVESIDAHERGEDFFQTYVGRRDLWQRVDAVRELSRDRIAELLGAPSSPEALRDDLETRGLGPKVAAGTFDLDPMSTPVMEVGGLLIPQSTMDRAVLEQMWTHVDTMIDSIHRNLGELTTLVERPPSGPGGIKPQSLREVDNSFRHGLRLLFHRAVPNVRTFRALELGENLGTHHVDLSCRGRTKRSVSQPSRAPRTAPMGTWRRLGCCASASARSYGGSWGASCSRTAASWSRRRR